MALTAFFSLIVNASVFLDAMLNYAYSVLIARLQIHLIADGYDPTLGIMRQRNSFAEVAPP